MMSCTSSASPLSTASAPSTSAASPTTQCQPSSASPAALAPGLLWQSLPSSSIPSSSLSSSTQPHPPSFILSTFSASSIDSSLLTQCADLLPALRPVERARVSAFGAGLSSADDRQQNASRVTVDDSCGVVVYTKAGRVLGQAFFCTFTVPDIGDVRWITQLVVSIAEMMLNNAMFRRNKLFAAGLASSHPAAVRALELAAVARINTAANVSYAQLIHSHCTLPYLRTARLVVTERQCAVNTQFFVDHTEVLTIFEQQCQQRPAH